MSYRNVISQPLHARQTFRSELEIVIESDISTRDTPRMATFGSRYWSTTRRYRPTNFRPHQPVPSGSSFFAWEIWQKRTSVNNVCVLASMGLPSGVDFVGCPPAIKTVPRRNPTLLCNPRHALAKISLDVNDPPLIGNASPANRWELALISDSSRGQGLFLSTQHGAPTP